MPKLVAANTLFIDGKNVKFELFEHLFHKMLKIQREMTKAMKINHFHAYLRQEALQTFRNISASNKKTFNDVLTVFRRNYFNLNHKLQPNTNGTNSRSMRI